MSGAEIGAERTENGMSRSKDRESKSHRSVEWDFWPLLLCSLAVVYNLNALLFMTSMNAYNVERLYNGLQIICFS